MKALILTCRFGQGHHSAAMSIAEEMRVLRPSDDVLVKDLFELSFPSLHNSIYHGYAMLMANGGGLYNFAYKKTAYGNQLESEKKNPLFGHIIKALRNYVASIRPDFIICTYSLAARMVAEYKRESGDSIPLITCVTDITCHNVWMNQETDFYLVAAESTKKSLLHAGVPEMRIAVRGVPVRQEFTITSIPFLDNLRAGVLLSGGGLGLLPENAGFYRALSHLGNIPVTVVAGRNHHLYQKLNGKYANIRVLGFVEDICHLMRESRLIIGKPGGVTMFESIHTRLPMLLLNPFLEQEVKNAQFVSEQGLGLQLSKDPEQAIAQIFTAYRDEAWLATVRKNMDGYLHNLDKQSFAQFLNSLSGQGRAA